MPYKVIEMFRDLPGKTSCQDCGRPGCFQLAAAVNIDEASLDQCPHLAPAELGAMEEKLALARGDGKGKAPPNHEQALARLREVMATADLGTLAENADGEYVAGPPEEIRLEFLGSQFRIGRHDIQLPLGWEDNIWVKVALLLHLTITRGAAPRGEWVAYRDLPNTVSKAASFDAQGDKLAEAYSGRLPELDQAVARLGGVPLPTESADRAYEIQALPRVALQIHIWEADEDFPSRVALLLDRGVLEHLDQEASVFLAEVIVDQLVLVGG